MSGTSRVSCSAINCINKAYKSLKCSFFRFPKNEERCRMWMQNMGRYDLRNRTAEYLYKNYRVCSKHFEQKMFFNNGKLIWNAVPTIFDVPNSPKPVAGIGSLPTKRKTQLQRTRKTTHTNVMGKDKITGRSQENVPTKRVHIHRLKSKVMELKKLNKQNEYNSIEDIIEKAKQHLPEASLKIFASQLRISKYRAKGRRYTNADKKLAFALHYQSPQAYRYLRTMFTLPHKSSIHRWLDNVNVQPGFHDNTFDIIKQKCLNMTSRDHVCALVLDEMSIKSSLNYNVKTDRIESMEDYGTLGRSKRLATHALVFMVRGLACKWKQPVGYFLSNNAMPGSTQRVLLIECIQ